MGVALGEQHRKPIIFISYCISSKEFLGEMNQFLRRALCGIALIVAAVGTTGCQHESQAEQEAVRTVSYRAVMESNKPVPEKVNTWARGHVTRGQGGSADDDQPSWQHVGAVPKGCDPQISCERRYAN